MAVESRFVVVRQGVEVETFMDKKSADEYDKMLDMADSLAEMLSRAPVELSEQSVEELSVYFARHRDDVLVALQAKKAKPEAEQATAAKASKEKVAKEKVTEKKSPAADSVVEEKKPAKATKVAKTAKSEKAVKLSEAS